MPPMYTEMCIHQRMDQQVARYPENVAVQSRDERVTYTELNARANCLADKLVKAGVKRGDVVALFMSRSIDMIVSMLAILKAGAAYLPLDESSPLSRQRKYLHDARVTHAISGHDPPAGCDPGQITVVPGASSRAVCSPSPGSSIPIWSRPEDKAYVMFTSGSTGGAKGVVVPHRAVLRLVVDTNYIEISPTDRILQLAPPFFDASTFEIWGALLNGATLVLSSASAVDPNALKRDVAESGVTIMWLTAALFHLIGDRYIDAIRPLKTLLAGGDVLSPRIVNRVLDAIPGIAIINGYGPTENTTFTCCHRMTDQNRPPPEGVPIGRPVCGTEIFILDKSLSPVAAGDVGELFTAGIGVALGYLNGNGDTNFFRDEKICDGLIFRTGDLVRENANQELEFVGRKDNLVKVRGFRVSLEEVKQTILRIQDVVDALVVIHKEDVHDEILTAYVMPRQGSNLDAEEIRRQLRGILSSYMIPDRIVLSEALPITMNGKLDKRPLGDHVT